MPRNSRYTIAILDEEKKERNRLMNFFENKFDVKEITKFDSIDSLISFIKAENIDALAIDYRLKEHNHRFLVNGDVIFKQVFDTLNGFPAFILTNDVTNAKRESKKINSFFIVDKKQTHLPDGKEKNGFLKEIESNIDTYKNDITEKLARFKKLNAKRNKGTLTEPEENDYLELNNFLSKVITGTSAIPMKYFSQETNKKLDEIIAKTDALIKKISQK